MNDTEKDKINLIYKNLQYISNTYNTSEQIFPIWEAAFALIVGQLMVAYFDPGICNNDTNNSIKLEIMAQSRIPVMK